MKKVASFFVLPIGLFVILLIIGSARLIKTAQFSLSIFNPAGAMEYIKDIKTDSESNTQSSKGESESFENPFKDFDPDNADQAPTPVVTQPPIDTNYPIVALTYAPILNNITYQRQNCYVKNMTKLTKGEVDIELLAEIDFEVEKNSSEPQILIMHTHATESYQNYPELFYDPEYTCRSLDTTLNMVSVGKIIAEKLNASGYNTLHDTTLHDHPSYNASYGRSKKTVEEYLVKYPSIKVVLDVHRDAIEKSDGTRIKPVINIQGQEYAQIMIISGADNGKLNMPNYRKNLRFASHFQNSMESLYPGFTRPILFDYRNYNQQLTTGSLLVEVGSHANTLQEAQNAGRLIAISLTDCFDKLL